MAQGTGLPGLPQPSDFATEAEGPDPASAGAGWAAVAHVTQQASQEFGTAEDMLAAHQHVVDQAQLASIKTGIDGTQAGIAADNPYDASAFSSAASQARSDAIAAVPSRYKMQAAQYWDLGAQTRQAAVATSGIARDHVLATQGIEARLKTVGETVGNEFQSGAPLATVMQSPAVTAGMAESDSLYNTLVTSKAYAPEQVDAMRAEQASAWKASAFTGHVLQTLQSQGSSAAIAEIERLQQAGLPNADGSAKAPDPNSWEAGSPISDTDRALMVAKARAAATSAISLQQQQATLVQQQQNAASTALDKKVADSVAQVELTGRPDASLTQQQFAGIPGGQAKYVAYLHSLADATDKHATNGDLARYATPEAAAEALSSASDLRDLPKDLGTNEGMEGFMRGLRLVETGTNPAQVSSKGAIGAYQLEPGTAKAMAVKLGIPYDQDRLLHDPAYNETLATQYVKDLGQRYAGDPFLVATAYHAGPGNVDHWIQKFGLPTPDTQASWLQQVRASGNPRSADYPVLVANAAKGGRAWAAFDQNNSAWSQNREANVGDPLQFAATHGRSDIQPLNLNGFSDPTQAKAWGQALVQRQAQGQNLSQAQGVPARLLTNSEASAYRDRIAANPSLGVQLATAATTALGSQGAVQFMHEIGQTDGAASVGVQTGLLSASGPAGARFAGSVQDGLQAKATGAKEAPLPKGVTWEKAQADIAPAFAHMGAGTMAGVLQTAQTARLGESQRGVPPPPEQMIRSALGGWTNPQKGEAFGGVAPVNGQATLHPVWMKVGTMPTAMFDIAQGGRLGADPPVYTNGQTMRPQDVQRMRPEALPDGRYVLRDPRTNQFARTRGGAPYEMDFDAAKPFLAARGGIVAQGY